MKLSTVFLYLLGQGRAILAIAETPGAVWLGLLFVLSAGFAREYDGEDLLREPWHLLLPFAASLATSLVLFSLLWLLSKDGKWTKAPFLVSFRKFLALYWMTAPLAWLYAIPFERFLSPPDAVRANLYLLGAVALWRVLLITRVASVLFQVKAWRVFFPVMLFADTVLLAVLWVTPKPVVVMMGGIRLTESEQLIQATTFLLGGLGLVSWLVWAIGTALSVRGLSRYLLAEPFAKKRVSMGAWSLAAFSLLIWLPILPWTQSEQQLRSLVDRDLKAGRIDKAFRLMNQHQRSDFPPHWDPPPRIGYGDEFPPVFDVLEYAVDADLQPWVLQIYSDKLGQVMVNEYSPLFWDGDQFERLLSVLERLPNREEFMAGNREGLEVWISEYSSKPPEQKARLRALLGEPPEPPAPE